MGTPDVRSYTTADGRQGASLTLRIASVQLLGAKPSGGSSDGAAPSNYTPTAAPNAADESMDDLPF